MLARAIRSRGRAAAGVLVLAALAGLAFHAVAGGGQGATAAPARVEPARAALFAQCIAGSSEIAPRAGHEARRHGVDGRSGTAPHTVCYAAIFPSGIADEFAD